jgi:hypothetical protein
MLKPWSRFEMNGKVLAVASLFVASAFLLAGCGRSGRPTIAPVSGHVSYKEKPVSGATVIFLCPGAPRQAVGITDEQGMYRLTTYNPNDGAMVGTHVVTVKKNKLEAGKPGEPADAAPPKSGAALSKAIEESMRESAQEAAKIEKAGSLLPAKYAQMKTSDLRGEVVAGENVINLELKD